MLHGIITARNNTLPQAKPGERIVFTDSGLSLLFGNSQFLVVKTPPGQSNIDSQGCLLTWMRLSKTGGQYCYAEDYKIVDPSEYTQKAYHEL